MARKALAVAVGYLLTAILISAGLTLVWKALGPDRALREGTFELTAAWMSVSLLVTLGAAGAGGAAAATVGRSPASAAGLAGLLLVLGLASAVLRRPPLPAVDSRAPTRAELTALEASTRAASPVAYRHALPVFGAGGALLGGALRRRG